MGAENVRGGIVELLLDRAADVNARSRDGGMPVKLAAAKEYTELAHLLRERGGRG